MNDNQKIGMTDGDDSQELQPTCMRAFDGWISVDDKEPETFGSYLCFCNDIVNSWQEVLNFDGFSWVQLYDEEEFPCIVTHWRPLPPPPVK